MRAKNSKAKNKKGEKGKKEKVEPAQNEDCKHAYSTFNISTSSADGQHLAREVLNNPYSTPPAEAMGLTGDQRFPAHEKPGKGSETNDNPGDDNAYRNEDPALGPQRKTWKPRPQSGIPPPLRPRSPSKDERQDKNKINNETSGSQSKLSSHTSSRPPLICSSETNESDSDGASVKSMPPKDKDPAFTNPGALLARLFAELHQRLERPASPSDAEAPARRVLWLMIENIPETQQPLALEFKNNDIVRWLDYDPNYPESNPASLPAGRYLECETWSGKPVVVPSEYARLISSTLEQAQVLQHRPRAQVIKDFVGTTDGDLSVAVGEVIYLLFERDVSYFMAMNTSFKRGRVPKTALNVLVAP